MQILGDLVHSHKNLDKDIFQHNSAAQDSLSEKQMNMIESKSLLRSSLEQQMAEVLKDVNPSKTEPLSKVHNPINQKILEDSQNIMQGAGYDEGEVEGQKAQKLQLFLPMKGHQSAQSMPIPMHVPQSSLSNMIKSQFAQNIGQALIMKPKPISVGAEFEEEKKNKSLTIKNRNSFLSVFSNNIRKIAKGSKQDDDEDDIFETIRDTEGQDESLFVIPFDQLNKLEQKERIDYLWKLTFIKSKGAAVVLKTFADLRLKILTFGTRVEIQSGNQDKFVQPKKSCPLIIMPDTNFKKIWNIVIMVLLIYTATFVPYRTAFLDEVSSGLIFFEYIVDSLFFIDILVNFASGYDIPEFGIVEVKWSKIAVKYFKSWFFLDLVTVFPFQILEDTQDASDSNDLKLLRLARLPRLYRLLRILRLFKMLRLLKYNKTVKHYLDMAMLNAGIMRLIKTTLMVFFFCHLIACFWFLSSKFNDHAPGSWVSNIGIADEEPSYQYLVSVYWSFQTITTVGFGDIPATTVVEQIISLFWMVFGVGFYSLTVGNLSTIIANMDTKNLMLKAKLNTFQDLAKRINLPEDLEMRIRRFIVNNNRDLASIEDQDILLAELPQSLRTEVVEHTHGNIIHGLKFIQDKSPDFQWQILPMLRPMHIHEEDILFSQGDTANEIYFILKGKVMLYVDVSDLIDIKGDDIDKLNLPFNMYVQGSYFGDSDCLMQQRGTREATASAECECQLYVIDKQQLMELFSRFSEIERQMMAIAKEKKKYHDRLTKQVVKRYNLPDSPYKKQKMAVINTHKSLRQRQNTQQKPEKKKISLNNEDEDFAGKIAVVGMTDDMKRVMNETKEPSRILDKNLPAIKVDELSKQQKSQTPRIKQAQETEQLSVLSHLEAGPSTTAHRRKNSDISQKSPKNRRVSGISQQRKSDSKNSSISSPKKATEEEKLAQQKKDIQHNLLKTKVLKESELYYQDNMNAFNNNMSLLALSTFEISQFMDNLNGEKQKISQMSSNIAAHTKYINEKSVSIENKLKEVHSKMQRLMNRNES